MFPGRGHFLGLTGSLKKHRSLAPHSCSMICLAALLLAEVANGETPESVDIDAALASAVATQLEAELRPDLEAFVATLRDETDTAAIGSETSSEAVQFDVRIAPVIQSSPSNQPFIASISVAVDLPADGFDPIAMSRVGDYVAALVKSLGYVVRPAGDTGVSEAGSGGALVAEVGGTEAPVAVISVSRRLARPTSQDPGLLAAAAVSAPSADSVSVLLSWVDEAVAIAAISALAFAALLGFASARRRRSVQPLPMPLGYAEDARARTHFGLTKEVSPAESVPAPASDVANAKELPELPRTAESAGVHVAAATASVSQPALELQSTTHVNELPSIGLPGSSAPGEWHRSTLARAAAESAKAKVAALTFEEALSMLRRLDRHSRQQVLERLPLHPSVKASLARTLR